MSKRQDFTIDAECDYAVPVVITDNDDVTPLNLAGCTLDWSAAVALGHAAVITKSSTVPGEITVTAAADGEATIVVAADDTEGLGDRVYVHKLVVTDTTTLVARVIRGFLMIVKT